MGTTAFWRRLRHDGHDITTQAVVAVAGLVAIASLVYTAPGTPWSSPGARQPVTAAPSAPTALTSPPTALTPAARPSPPVTPASPPSGALDHTDMTSSAGGIVRAPGLTVLIDLAPGRAGRNTVAVTALGPDGAPATVTRWEATTTSPDTGASVALPLRAFGPGAATAEADLPTPGAWTFTVTLHTTAGATTVASAVTVAAA